jgi:hypothetical protein
MKMKFQNIVLAGIAAVAFAGAAQAQDAARVVPVSERMAAENLNLGVRAGGFVIVPKVDLEETYNDNIYATTNNTESDFITTVRPEVAAKSNWSRHALNAKVNAEWNKYADNSREDHTNYLAAIDGRVDVMKETSIGGGVAFARQHEDRGDPNSLGASVEPTQVDVAVARAGVYRGLGRFNARLDTEAKDLDYKNGFTSAGALVDNNLRDRTEYTQTARVGYKATPGTEIFLRGSTDARVYERKGGASVNRSSHGDKVVAGVDVELSGKTKAEAYAGWMNRNYSDASRKDVDDVTYGGKLTWNATDLTTVTAQVDRDVEETVVAGSSSYVNTSYRAGVEHALTRSLLATGGLGYANNDYKGFAANQREDDIAFADAGLKYYINRCLSAGVNYRYYDRDSNVAGGDFDRNTIMVGLTANY